MHRWLGATVCGWALCLASASAAAQGGYSVVSSGGRAGPTVVPGPAPVEAPTPVGTNASGVRPQGPVTLGAPASPLPPAGNPLTDITPTRAHGGRGVEVVAPHRPEEYGGVSPGSPTVPPGFRRLLRAGARGARSVPVVTWPGFQMVPNGSRIFLAMTAQPVVTVTRPAAHQVVYHLESARVFLSNNRRPLITESFETPVQRTFLRTRGRGVDLVIELRADAEPRMSQESGAQGLSYLFVDLPPWSSPNIPRLDMPGLHIESDTGAQPRPPPPGPSVMPRMDETERPPPVIR